MLKLLLQFSFFLLLSVGFTYGAHVLTLTYYAPEKPLDLVNFAYKLNIGITFLFTSTIILASERLKEQLGFIFLLSGFIKLGIFLFLIKNSEFSINKTVFLHFFIPYVVCVIVEIIFVIRILDETNFKNNN